jgi:Protein kinase domain
MSSDDFTFIQAGGTAFGRLEPGDEVMGGRYRIDAVLEGGMEADAYRGTRVTDGRTVFVKSQWRRPGKHRALILDRLLGCDHDGCVRLLDFDAVERPIEIYEWTENEQLSLLLARQHRFSEASIRELVRRLAAAIEYLHRSVGTAHRDVKPSNILVVDPSVPIVKLADFGVMTLVDAGGATTFAGTKKYAPPEALRWRLTRSELLAYDWWSLGRVVQEIVDGIHPYDRIAATLSDLEIESDAMEAVWCDILSEQSRARYGRAGQLEHSAERWRPLLRGLLTTDREARWGCAEIERWLAGEAVLDSYDALPDEDRFRVADRDAEVLAEVRRLSTPESWDEACCIVVESDGIVALFRGMSDNKRVRSRLRTADAAYDSLIRLVSARTAEEILAMLVLRVIGGEATPLTLRGYELDVDLLLEWARTSEPGTRELILALSENVVLAAIEASAPNAAARLRDFAAAWGEMQRVLEAWVPSAALNRQVELMVAYSAQIRDANETLIADARAIFANSRNAAVDTAFSAEHSDAEAAALAFAVAHAETFDFETIETVERRAEERRHAERMANEGQRRRAELVVAADRARTQAEHLGRTGFALGGAVAGGTVEALLWAGTVSQMIATILCVGGGIVGTAAGAKEGCGPAIGGLLVGLVLGALLGTVVSNLVHALILGFGGPYVAACLFGAVGAAVGLFVRSRRLRA